MAPTPAHHTESFTHVSPAQSPQHGQSSAPKQQGWNEDKCNTGHCRLCSEKIRMTCRKCTKCGKRICAECLDANSPKRDCFKLAAEDHIEAGCWCRFRSGFNPDFSDTSSGTRHFFAEVIRKRKVQALAAAMVQVGCSESMPSNGGEKVGPKLEGLGKRARRLSTDAEQEDSPASKRTKFSAEAYLRPQFGGIVQTREPPAVKDRVRPYAVSAAHPEGLQRQVPGPAHGVDYHRIRNAEVDAGFGMASTIPKEPQSKTHGSQNAVLNSGITGSDAQDQL